MTQVTPIATLKSQLVAMNGQFSHALPSHIKPEKFQRVVMTVVQSNPDLLNADRQSLFDSCIKCAADGLIPDGREAALTVFNTKVKVGNRDEWIKKVQYIPMFTGIQKRVRNSGSIESVQSHVIYENDEFVWVQGFDERIEHKPLFPGNRGKAVGAYAIAKFKDGTRQFEVMDVAAIEKIKNASKSSKFGPWVDWWDEMARKSVFKRLAKWLPLNADVDDLIAYDNSIDAEEQAVPENPIALETKKTSKLDAIVQEEPEQQQEEPKEYPTEAPQSDEDF